MDQLRELQKSDKHPCTSGDLESTSINSRIKNSLQPYIARVQQLSNMYDQSALREFLDVYRFKPLCNIRKIDELLTKTEAALQENLRVA